MLNEEARVTPIILEVGITQQGIDKCKVKRMLIDSRATKNILYFKCFKEMGMHEIHLKPSAMVFEGFTTYKIPINGTVRIKGTLESDERMRTKEVNFMSWILILLMMQF